MKTKIVLLPRKVNSRPIPYWEIGAILANIKEKCQKLELVDLESKYFCTKKNYDFLGNHNPHDLFKKDNQVYVLSVLEDIGSLDFDLIHFFIDWWNETLPLAVAIARKIRKKNNKIKILLSGTYLNRYGGEIIEKFKFIDYIGVSDPELIFNEILNGTEDPSKIPNIVYFSEEENVVKETKRQAIDVNDLNFQDYDLFFGDQCEAPQILPVKLSRGCIYRCFFCACLSGEKFSYYKEIDEGIKHIKKYKSKYGVNYFYFDDDAINFNNDYLENFLDRLIAEKLNIKWSAYFFAKNLSSRLIKKIKESGCIHIRWGIETLDPEISKMIAKGIKIIEAEEILNETAKAGIANQISLIVGFPNEKKESIQDMKSFISRNRHALRVVNTYVFKPRSGTLAYQLPNKYGVEILQDKTIFKKDVVPFNEINGLKWKDKKKVSEIYFQVIDKEVQKNKLMNIDPREFFKDQVGLLGVAI